MNATVYIAHRHKSTEPTMRGQWRHVGREVTLRHKRIHLNQELIKLGHFSPEDLVVPFTYKVDKGYADTFGYGFNTSIHFVDIFNDEQDLYCKLNILQRLKLSLMFGNHWLTKPEGWRWLISFVIAVIALLHTLFVKGH